MKRGITFLGGVVCGFVVGSSLRCGLVGRVMYGRGYQAGAAKVQAEAIGRGYAVITTLEDWAGKKSRTGESWREFAWLPPDVIERNLKAVRWNAGRL